jgi:3-deoxy-manno-octulosonate cytidylyltransferase (CMP-KDO synthetase)
MTDKALIVIPARYPSTRLPGKPLVDIGGIPMIVRTAIQSRKASLAAEVVVAVDDERIKNAVESAGFRCVISDLPFRTGTERVAWAAQLPEFAEYDIIMNVQGDEPLVDPVNIDKCIAAFSDFPDAAGVIVYTADADASHAGHATVQAMVDCNSRVLYLSRAFIPATKTGGRIEGYPYRYVHGFYGYRKATLQAYDGRVTDGWKHEDIDQLLALESGFPLYAIDVPWVEPSVNTPEDLELVRQIVAKQEVGA